MKKISSVGVIVQARGKTLMTIPRRVIKGAAVCSRCAFHHTGECLPCTRELISSLVIFQGI